MKKLYSKQTDVRFIWCPDPITIDKRKSWGENSDNYQLASNGAFLKMKDGNTISHLVQPNEDKSAPIGWVKGSKDGYYDKSPIYIDEVVRNPGETVELATRDGLIRYEVKEPVYICYNEKDGGPDESDCWAQKVSDVEKNYLV